MATANTAIKITSLPNIGNNIAPSTLIPVVNMAGAPVTQKANLQITGNLILAGAGTANFVPAGLANLAYSVVNAAQPNITSTGTLNVNTLKVSGGVNGQYLQTDGTGNLAWVSGSSSGNGEVGGSNTQIQFNDAGNFGGNTGFTFVKTTGILAAPFADVSGVANIVGGGATVATKSVLNVASTFGSNSSAEPASAQAIRGRVTGANLTKTRNYVTGVTGQYLVTGTNASEFIKAGVLGVVGDQTTTADGAVVAYLDGDGGLTTANAAYAVSMKNSTPNSGFNYGLDLQFINLNLGGVTTSTFKQADIRFNNGVTLVANTAGNISINGNLMTSAEVVASGAIESGTGLTTGGYLSVDGNTDLHNTIVTGNLSATGNITANNLGNISAINLTGSNSNVLYGNGVFAAVTGGGNTGNVTFNDINIIGDGNLHLQPDSTNAASYLDIFLTSGPDLHLVASAAANLILGKDDGPNVMTSWDGNVYVQSWNLDTGNVGGIWTFNGGGSIDIPAESNSFDEGRIQSANGYPTLLAYGSGSHGGPELDCMDGDDPNDMGNAGVLRNTLYLNNDDGLYVGMNENNVANTFTGSWRFTPQGTTIFPTLEVDLHNGGVQTGQVLQFGNSSQQAIITGPTPEANVNAQRLIIQGQRGNGTGEGGDVYLWAGDADINGGDIKIYAGDADNASAGGGGYINLAGGDGFNYGGDITLNGGYGTNGYGGQISINGGTGQTDGGPAYINGGQASGNGGAVSITAGYGGANGGQVVISGGQSALGLSHYGNVVVSAGASAWTFDWNGNLTVPQNIHGSGALQLQGLANGNTTINIGSGVGGDIDMVSNLGNINLYTASNQPWIFDQGGNFTAPGAINVGNMSIGTVPGDITANNNTTVAFNVTGSDGGFLVNYLDEVGNANTSGGELAFNSELGNATYRISLSDDLGDGFATKIWRFDGTGNLTLPTNAFTVNYANGTQVSIGGGGANTGNVTFSDQVVIGTGDASGGGGLYLAPGTNSTANLQYLRVRGGDVATHIHLDTGNNAYYDQYFGADNKFVKLEANGNVVINTDDSNGNGDTWSFDTTGKFNLPGNLVIAGNANVFGTVSALIQPNDDKPLLAISSGANGAVSSVWVEDIGNIGTSNIAAVYANPIPGSGIVRIAVGQNGGNAGPNLWDFGTDGNLTLPGDSHGITFDTTAETKIQSEMGGIRIYSPDISLVLTEYGNASNVLATWQFSNDGNLTIPGGGAVWTLGAGTAGLTANFADPYAVNLGLDYTTNTATLAGANSVVIQSNTGANSNQWTFNANGTTTFPGDLIGNGASPAPTLSGFSSLSAADSMTVGSNAVVLGSSGNVTLTGQLNFTNGQEVRPAGNAIIGMYSNSAGIDGVEIYTNVSSDLFNQANVIITANSATTPKIWAFDKTGNITFPDASVQTTAWTGTVALANVSGVGNIASVNLDGNASNLLFGNGTFSALPSAATVDITNTNGLSTVYYPTFVESRTTGQIVRADVDLSYSTDNNTLSAGNISVSGTIQAGGKIGYSSGSSVTQTTNRGQGVTINSLAGEITLVSDTIAAGDSDALYVICNKVDATSDIVLVQVTSYNPGTYLPIAQPTASPFAGFLLNVTNISAFASPTETITIRFMVIKAPSA